MDIGSDIHWWHLGTHHRDRVMRHTHQYSPHKNHLRKVFINIKTYASNRNTNIHWNMEQQSKKVEKTLTFNHLYSRKSQIIIDLRETLGAKWMMMVANKYFCIGCYNFSTINQIVPKINLWLPRSHENEKYLNVHRLVSVPISCILMKYGCILAKHYLPNVNTMCKTSSFAWWRG